MTFEGEIPNYLNSINALLRNQYSLAYELQGPHDPGKKYKLDVRVDIDGDGQYESEKQFVVQHRGFYIAPTPKTEMKAAK